eukprot:scaffold33772_cov20-Tisochrysis_lutea.AAC.1
MASMALRMSSVQAHMCSCMYGALHLALEMRQALEAQLVQEGMSLEDRQTVLAELERRESDYTRLQVFAGGQQQNYADVWVMRMPACYASLNPLSYVKDKP